MLVEAVVIVLAVLVLFLMNLRTTLITITAIPISLAARLLIMDALGLGLNVMTLGGLTVAIGVLVDDAIIDVENVFRRLKQNRARQKTDRRPTVEVIFDASNEIRPAMVFATIIIVMVFVPLLFLEGLEGRFFKPLALTYMVSILASLVVALTVVPAMCRFMLKGRLGGKHEDRDAWLVRWIKRAYEPSLRASIRLRAWVLAGAGVATAGALLWRARSGHRSSPRSTRAPTQSSLIARPAHRSSRRPSRNRGRGSSSCRSTVCDRCPANRMARRAPCLMNNSGSGHGRSGATGRCATKSLRLPFAGHNVGGN